MRVSIFCASELTSGRHQRHPWQSTYGVLEEDDEDVVKGLALGGLGSGDSDAGQGNDRLEKHCGG